MHCVDLILMYMIKSRLHISFFSNVIQLPPQPIHMPLYKDDLVVAHKVK